MKLHLRFGIASHQRALASVLLCVCAEAACFEVSAEQAAVSAALPVLSAAGARMNACIHAQATPPLRVCFQTSEEFEPMTERRSEDIKMMWSEEHTHRETLRGGVA